MQIQQNNIYFGRSRINQYTTFQKKVMSDMKKAALQNNWCDIYSGKKFTKDTNPPSIEHLIPCSAKTSNKVIELKSNGLQLNGLDNIFPVGSIGNAKRKSEPFKETVKKNPKIFTRLLDELDKYSKYKSDYIDGKSWANRLRNTIAIELNGISSDIKTRKIFFA